MKNIGIISNNEKREAIEIAGKIHDYLIKKDRDIRIFFVETDKMPEIFGLPSVSESEFSNKNDVIISIGGDGTFLRASKYSFLKEIPVLGINVGNLGFLTVVDKCNINEALDRLLKNKYKIEKRMLLEGRFFKDDQIIENKKLPYLALNEFAITRSTLGKIIRFEIIVNKISIKKFAADGIIISTPTGSTAYSLSAGGPIVEPKSEVIIITPICPHTLLSRSIILGPDNELEIMVSSRNETDGVSVDGKTIQISIKPDYIFKVKKSRSKLNLITFNKDTFLKVFKEKFIEKI
ncbi:MAG: NAD(+)/NADH kinase [Actinomycetota bacterium]|nr:NAD(+)/NADH kinase [Actinomycetota bacterium]